MLCEIFWRLFWFGYFLKNHYNDICFRKTNNLFWKFFRRISWVFEPQTSIYVDFNGGHATYNGYILKSKITISPSYESPCQTFREKLCPIKVPRLNFLEKSVRPDKYPLLYVLCSLCLKINSTCLSAALLTAQCNGV